LANFNINSKTKVGIVVIIKEVIMRYFDEFRIFIAFFTSKVAIS
jgi:hypothetical protein